MNDQTCSISFCILCLSMVGLISKAIKQILFCSFFFFFFWWCTMRWIDIQPSLILSIASCLLSALHHPFDYNWLQMHVKAFSHIFFFPALQLQSRQLFFFSIWLLILHLFSFSLIFHTSAVNNDLRLLLNIVYVSWIYSERCGC